MWAGEHLCYHNDYSEYFYLIVSFSFLTKYNLHVIYQNIIFTIMNSFPYNKSRLTYFFSRGTLDVSEASVT